MRAAVTIKLLLNWILKQAFKYVSWSLYHSIILLSIKVLLVSIFSPDSKWRQRCQQSCWRKYCHFKWSLSSLLSLGFKVQSVPHRRLRWNHFEQALHSYTSALSRLQKMGFCHRLASWTGARHIRLDITTDQLVMVAPIFAQHFDSGRCGQACQSKSGWCSFELSPSYNDCNLNKEWELTPNKFQDFLFCKKSGKS